ncbi:MAG: rod shape-determining protein MreC [Desulfobacca sp.]|nr:rod shape-determining protein MreC [Desulfobacca sp.]
MVIKKLRHVFIVWLTLLALLAVFSSFSQTDRDYYPVESSLVDGLLPVISVFSSIQTGIGSWLSRHLSYTENQKGKESLNKQISQLKMENIQLREMVSGFDRFKKLLQLKTELPGPSQVAEVVGRGPSPFLQTFFINKGRRDGLVRGMPVLLKEGVVGRLEKTSANFAQVIMINDPSFAVDCLIQRSRVRGILTGIPGEKNCRINYVARTEDILPGDIIITSGLDQLYPKGLILGRIIRVDPKVKGNFIFIEVVPEVKLSQIEEVLIFQKRPRIPDQEEPGDD